MGKFMDTQRKIEKGVVFAYKTVENGVVSGYKAIENGVVGGYKIIENRFTDAFLTPGGDIAEGKDEENIAREE
jgi:hypothetical protein